MPRTLLFATVSSQSLTGFCNYTNVQHTFGGKNSYAINVQVNTVFYGCSNWLNYEKRVNVIHHLLELFIIVITICLPMPSDYTNVK